MVRVAVWPHRAIAGWPGDEASARLPRVKTIELYQALSLRWHTDCHCTAYVAPPTHPWRLKRAALSRGVSPVMQLAVFDIDDKQRVNGAARREWLASEAVKVRELVQDMPGAAWYRSRGGYRLLWRLPAPRELTADTEHEWGDSYRGWCAWLKERYDIAADVLCDWTRCFRLPRVVREGVPYEGRVRLPRELGVWDCPAPPVPKAVPSLPMRESPLPHGEGVWVRVLRARGHLGARTRGGYICLCPRRAEHSTNTDWTTATMVFPAARPGGWGALWCLHEGCQAALANGRLFRELHLSHEEREICSRA